MTDRVTGVTERLDDIAARLALIDDRTKALEEVDERIQALKDAANQAEQTTQKALGPGRRAAATSRSAAPAVVAGALYARDGRDA